MAEKVTERPAVADYTVRAPVRIRDPLVLKERTVRDYKRSHERIGCQLSSTQLDRLARADLELVDAYGRALRPAPKPSKRPHSRAQKAVSEPGSGLKLKKVQRPARPDIIDTPGQFMDSKWQHALGRIRRIIAGATQAASRLESVSTCECPDLALRVLKLHADYEQRNRYWKHNPYYGKSQIDQVKILRRKLEDICDDSSGRLGPWWVPK